MRSHRFTRRHFLAACGLAPFALAGCGPASDKDDKDRTDRKGGKEPPPEEAAREEKRIALALKQIGLAMHNHESAMQGFPMAGLCLPPPKGEKPPLVGSRPAVPLTPVENANLQPRTTHWRVALLPYLEEDIL